VASFAIASSAGATTTATSSKRDAVRAKIEEKMDLRKDKLASTTQKVAEKREAVKAKMEAKSDDKMARIEQFASRVMDRIEAAFNRIDNLIERIGKLADRLEDKGRDVASVRAKLNEAKQSVTTGRAELAKIETNINATLASSTASTTPKESLRSIHTSIKQAAGYVRTAHAKTVEALKAIGTIPGAKDKATTTTATSTNNYLIEFKSINL
jgi:chromosome segregation ATPase